MNEIKIYVVPKIFTLSIDYRVSLEDLILEGYYIWKNREIKAENFPITSWENVELEAVLFHFSEYVYQEEVCEMVRAIDKDNPWELAKIEHLLFFGSDYPEEQWKYPIIGLGSTTGIGGNSRVPCLIRDITGRGLDLHWFSFGWSVRFRFLAVRKKRSNYNHPIISGGFYYGKNCLNHLVVARQAFFMNSTEVSISGPSSA